jgi:hypothetical protein
VDTGQEVDVGVVQLPGPLPDPQHVRAAVVRLAGEGVDTGQRLLVAQQQRLVGGVDVDGGERRVGVDVDPDGLEEVDGAVDVVGDLLVPLALRDPATNSWFQAWTRWRSANPPLVNARSRFSVEAAVWYIRIRRSGSGVRFSASAPGR